MIERFTKSQNIPQGEISAERKMINGEFKTHWHDFSEIEFVISGSGKYIVDGRVYNIEENMLFFMTPINFHSVSIDKNTEIINIMFSENLCGSTLFPFAAGVSENAVCFSENDAVFIKNLLFELISAVGENDRIYYTSLLNTLLLKIVKYTKNKSIPTLNYAQSAMLYVLNNFRSDITLTSAASYTGLSPAYLSAVFAAETGVNFKEYLNSIRYEYARKILTYSDMSVTEVCFESGFGDYSNFIRGFKRRFGITPGQLKKE